MSKCDIIHLFVRQGGGFIPKKNSGKTGLYIVLIHAAQNKNPTDAATTLSLVPQTINQPAFKIHVRSLSLSLSVFHM